MDLAEVMIGDRDINIEFIGIRPGERIHELMISEEEISRTIKKGDYYVIRPILPEIQGLEICQPVLSGELSSADGTMSKAQLKDFLEKEGLLDF